MNRLLSRLRVLVVEDEMLVLMETEDMLTELGAEAIVAAATNEQAIALIEAQPFDVALLDLNLNGVRSYPVADLLAARGVPFAFATGYGAHGLREGDHSRPLLTKPFEIEQLKNVLTALLDAAPLVSPS